MTPPSAARGKTRSRAQKPDGIELRCHHLSTVLGGKPSSRASKVAATSRPSEGDHSSMISWNERGRLLLDMDANIGQSVLSGKGCLGMSVLGQTVLINEPTLSQDLVVALVQDVAVVPKIPRREARRGFIQRTREARVRSGLSQIQMAEQLGIEQGTYKNYETNRPLPHELVLPFCHICQIRPGELYGPMIVAKARKQA